MFLADLHIHSTFSDGKMTIPEIVDFFGKRRFGAIAITDHLCETNTIWGKAAQHLRLTLTPATFPIYKAILKTEAARAWKRYRMVVIPGYEITKNPLLSIHSSHVLALNVSNYISADPKIETILEAIRYHGGLSVAAHPRQTPSLDKQTFYLWTHRERLSQAIDAWEVANGRVFFHDVDATSLPKLAGSDFHKRADFESWKTILDCKLTPEAILAAIRAQDLTFEYVEEVSLDPFVDGIIDHPVVGYPSAHAAGNLALAKSV